MRVRLGAAAWIVAAVGYFVAEAVAAAAIPGYGYATDYISTLGRPSVSPHADLINAAFLAQGVLFPAGAALVARGLKLPKPLPLLVFAVINGIGNVLVAVVHSGAGSPWHVVGAAMAIVGGNAAILTGARALRQPWATMLGVVGLTGLALVALGVPPIGSWERVSVYAIFGWQAVTAVLLLARRTPVGEAGDRTAS